MEVNYVVILIQQFPWHVFHLTMIELQPRAYHSTHSLTATLSKEHSVYKMPWTNISCYSIFCRIRSSPVHGTCTLLLILQSVGEGVYELNVFQVKKLPEGMKYITFQCLTFKIKTRNSKSILIWSLN